MIRQAIADLFVMGLIALGIITTFQSVAKADPYQEREVFGISEAIVVMCPDDPMVFSWPFVLPDSGQHYMMRPNYIGPSPIMRDPVLPDEAPRPTPRPDAG